MEKISQNSIWIFFQRCTGHIFTIEAILRWQHIESSDAFLEFSACKVYKEILDTFSRFLRLKTKLFGMKFRCIFELSATSVYKNVLGAFSRFLRPKTKLLAVWSRRSLEVFTLQVKKKFWTHFLDFCVQKRRYFPWISDAFWKFSSCEFYRKSSGRIFPIYASKNEAVCRGVQTHFESTLPARFTEKVVGAIPWFVHPKTKLFAVKFRRIREVLCLQVLKKKLWAQFHDLCVQKWSCLPWSSDAFWKFSACKFYRKSCGRNFTICATKNEAVCCEVQTHSGSSLPARFTEKVVSAIPRFVRPKTKLFAVKFRCSLEVFALQILQKMFWVHFPDLCVQKWSCLLWSSGAFWKFPLCKVYENN